MRKVVLHNSHLKRDFYSQYDQRAKATSGVFLGRLHIASLKNDVFP